MQQYSIPSGGPDIRYSTGFLLYYSDTQLWNGQLRSMADSGGRSYRSLTYSGTNTTIQSPVEWLVKTQAQLHHKR